MKKRMHICGAYGSGKTTLAKKLSGKLNIPYYSLDDIKYLIKYGKIRNVKERIKNVKEICKKKQWITEGTWSDYAEDAFKKADLVIILKTPLIICIYRIIKRYLVRKKEKDDNFRGCLKIIKGIFRYYFSKSPVSFYSHEKLARKYGKKHIIIKRDFNILEKIYNN